MTNATSKVEITCERVPSAREVLDLYGKLNWAKAASADPDRFQNALERSWPIVTAWNENRLVGVCRFITDGEYTAFIAELAVHPDYQNNGVGSALLEKTLELLDGFDTITLVTSHDRMPFWGKFGFVDHVGAMMIRPR